jgi:radical SAM protein with 4Fe4S-binding SPASM domain
MKLPKYIEVETSRFCNRLCEWCPNYSLGDRKVQEFLPWTALERIAGTLAKVNYDGWFAFHNYNEPLANPRIIAELSLISSMLPAARSTIFSNGDRLTAELYSDLVISGLSQMRVTIYPKDRRVEPSHETLWAWLQRRPFLGDKNWKQIVARQGPALVHEGRPEILLISPNITGYYDRGGTVSWLSVEMRTEPCLLTAHSLSIDYRGNIKMCCNVVTGSESHNAYMVGNVRDDDILDVWSSPAFEAMRNRHAKADWSATPICRTCRQQLRPIANVD